MLAAHTKPHLHGDLPKVVDKVAARRMSLDTRNDQVKKSYSGDQHIDIEEGEVSKTLSWTL